MYKKIITMILILLFSTIISSCSSSNIYEYIIDENYNSFIILGTSADYPPYEWPMRVNGQQQIVGIDIEIAKRIAKKLEKNLKIVNKGFDFLLEDLQNDKIDFVLAGMTPTDERRKIVDFSKIYYKAVQVILIREENIDKYTSFASLNEKNVRIGAQIGSVQQDIAKTFTNSQKQFIQVISDLVLRLKENQIEGLILERPVAEGYLNNIKGLAIANFEIGDPEDGSAVAVKKGNTQLLELINQVIDELITTKELDQIISEMILKNTR